MYNNSLGGIPLGGIQQYWKAVTSNGLWPLDTFKAVTQTSLIYSDCDKAIDGPPISVKISDPLLHDYIQSDTDEMKCIYV